MVLDDGAAVSGGAASLREATSAWVHEHLLPGERIAGVARLYGGWTAEIRRLDISGPDTARSLVLRSFADPRFAEHAAALLTREAGVLRLLEPTRVPAARLVALDAQAARCEHPSLLMTLLPGRVCLSDEGARERACLLADELVGIHRLDVSARSRPRAYEPWIEPELVRLPAETERSDLWRRAVELIRRPPPAHTPCFLHRDFHPGNVLLDGGAGSQRITGVLDWVETSWGPADLDVAHCSTNLALLHGVPAGMGFVERYADAGGSVSARPGDHLYWRLLDALAFAPTAERVAEPWRALGRHDLTDELVARRLEDYVQALMDRYA